MMRLILSITVLVASTTGLPRSRGEPLQRTIPLQSGDFQYAVPATPPRQRQIQSPQPAPLQAQPLANSQSQGAVFLVDPDTLQPTRVDNLPSLIPTRDTNPPSVQPNPFVSGFQSQQPGNQPRPNFQVNQQSFVNQQPFQIDPQLLQNINFGNNPANTRVNSGPAEMAKRLIGNPPGGALLVGSNPPLFPIEKRLISNYTKLRPVVTDTFRCSRDQQPKYAGYGYYADVENECQIFHVCLPWKDLFPNQFAQDVTYQFSFICPNQTVFSQDSMTCTWKSEAIPCELSPELYWLNDNFFRKVPSEDGFGTRYANVNEKLTPPLVYDYDDYNPKKTE